jgi:hypothetical protein
MTEKEILKIIWLNQQSLEENLLKTEDVKKVWESLLNFLDQMPNTSIIYLRYQKLKRSKMWTWWTNRAGYPAGNPWQDMFRPFLNILEQYLAEKTIKERIDSKDFFVESRIQGEDQHIFIGDRKSNGDKAHITIDGKTGEIRIDDKDQQPEEFVHKIETILILKNGKKIRTTRELLEEIN